jgi:hypothetical protein
MPPCGRKGAKIASFGEATAKAGARMADALYALEKLADAADALETGAGSVHERLFEAFTCLVRIGPEDMPDGDLRLAFAELMGALTCEEAKGTEGQLVATLKVMDDEQAQNIARAIVDLYHALGRCVR